MNTEMLAKVTSGRWLLTVACACVFVYTSVTGVLDAAAVSAVLGSVFQAYFNRPDRAATPPTASTTEPSP